MRTRLALVALLTALLGFGSLPALPVRAAEFKYDFEGCEQGWEAKKGGNWVRSAEHIGSSNVSYAMSNVLYQTDESRGDTLISKPHNWGGGKGKITLRARWQFEWWPPETGPTLTTLDRASLDVSSDGGKTWKSRKGFGFPNGTFPEFETVEVDFDAPAGPILLRFILLSDTSIETFGIEIDDITVPTAAPDGVGCK